MNAGFFEFNKNIYIKWNPKNWNNKHKILKNVTFVKKDVLFINSAIFWAQWKL